MADHLQCNWAVRKTGPGAAALSDPFGNRLRDESRLPQSTAAALQDIIAAACSVPSPAFDSLLGTFGPLPMPGSRGRTLRHSVTVAGSLAMPLLLDLHVPKPMPSRMPLPVTAYTKPWETPKPRAGYVPPPPKRAPAAPGGYFEPPEAAAAQPQQQAFQPQVRKETPVRVIEETYPMKPFGKALGDLAAQTLLLAELGCCDDTPLMMRGGGTVVPMARARNGLLELFPERVLEEHLTYDFSHVDFGSGEGGSPEEAN